MISLRVLFCLAVVAGGVSAAAPVLAQTAAAPAAASLFPPPKLNPGDPPLGAPLSQFNADGSYRPAFDQATTLKLNAIIRRAKDAIDAFDARLAKPVAALEAGERLPAGAPSRAAIVADLAERHKAAASAQAEIVAQQPVLDATGRYYSKLVFAGMVKFTREVEAELREHLDKLAAKPKAH